MLRLLGDENFNHNIVRGLLRRKPEINIVSVHDVNLRRLPDQEVLAWAAANDRIVLTHDRATMPGYAYERVAAGEVMPGVFVISNQLPLRHAIDEIVLVDSCTEQVEWKNLVVYLPL